jgi:DNA-binding NtrC family response regulator
MSSWKVLIVDDDVAVSRILVRVFQRAGFETLSAANGEQALGFLIQDAGIHALISDIQMPRMSGKELVTHLAHHGPYLPSCTFIATSRSEVGERTWVEALKTVRLIEKPVSPKQVLRLVTEHLTNGEAEKNGPAEEERDAA